MRLFLLFPLDDPEDTFLAIAPSEEEARRMTDGYFHGGRDWTDPQEVQVTDVGETSLDKMELYEPILD